MVFASNFMMEARNFHVQILLLMNCFFVQSFAFFVAMKDHLNIKDVQKDLKMSIEEFNFECIGNLDNSHFFINIHQSLASFKIS
jgi:hypothetical protein